MNIGFIGLGNMGTPMAKNLAAAGHDVTGFDILAGAPESVARAENAAIAATDRQTVITMLPNGQALRDVAAEILPVLAPNTIFIDCSTTDIESTQAVAQLIEDSGRSFLDAPVSGGVDGAAKGTLTFMVGGATDAVEEVRPLFEIMGSRMVHCGASGAGQAAKVCNNMILGATMIATCESFALADSLGLDRSKLFEVVSTSSGFSWSMNVYCPAPGVGPLSPADRNYSPGFATDLMVKDLKLSQQAANANDVHTPISALATEIYCNYLETGGSGMDFSAIFEAICDR